MKIHMSTHQPEEREDLHKDIMDLIWKYADWDVSTKLWFSNWLDSLTKGETSQMKISHASFFEGMANIKTNPTPIIELRIKYPSIVTGKPQFC